MKTYKIQSEVWEYDSETGTACYSLGLPEKFGPFTALELAQRFFRSLPIDREASPSPEPMGSSQPEDLEFFWDEDLFAALTYAIACSKRTHQGLHALDASDPAATCANAIYGVAGTLTDLLGELMTMVDRTRRAGRSWALLSVDERNQSLRESFEKCGYAYDFESLSSVWWEPWDPVVYELSYPATGCPAHQSVSQRLAQGFNWRSLFRPARVADGHSVDFPWATRLGEPCEAPTPPTRTEGREPSSGSGDPL